MSASVQKAPEHQRAAMIDSIRSPAFATSDHVIEYVLRGEIPSVA